LLKRIKNYFFKKDKPKGIRTYGRKVKTIYPDATSNVPQGTKKSPSVIYLPPDKTKPKVEEKLFPCPLFYRASLKQCKGIPPYSRCPYWNGKKCTHPHKKSYADVLREAFYPDEVQVT